MRIKTTEQVNNFIGSLAPAPKRRLRAGIRGLGKDRGDTKDLVDELLGYKRLRVGDFRVIYKEAFEEGEPVRKCLFAERRNVIYELFAKLLLDELG
jgi:mRNA-degrading endonuclease RelE of RelBE toxin-antitoxin system